MYQHPGSDRRVVWGGTSMSFQRDPNRTAQASAASRGGKGAAAGAGVGMPDALNTFMVASEGGRLFRCYHDASDVACADWQKAVLAGARAGHQQASKQARFFVSPYLLACGARASLGLARPQQRPQTVMTCYSHPGAPCMHAPVSLHGRPCMSHPPSSNACVHAPCGADAPPAGEKVELRNPIKDSSYQAHSGAAFGVDCSPFVRELFLSAGADGSVRLYSAVRGPPLLSAEPTATFMHSVAWSPFRPLVFAAAAGE